MIFFAPPRLCVSALKYFKAIQRRDAKTRWRKEDALNLKKTFLISCAQVILQFSS